MPFTRFVEVGRVVMVNYGPSAGKLATIVDVVDSNKCLVDGPTTGVPRQVITYRRIALTDLKCGVGRGAKAAALKKAWKADGIEEVSECPFVGDMRSKGRPNCNFTIVTRQSTKPK